MIIFVLFSLSSSKLIPYILPVFPAMALIIGRSWVPVFSGKIKIAGINGYTASLFCILLGTAIILYPYFSVEQYIGPLAGAVIGSLFLIEGLLSLISAYRRNAAAFFTVFAAFSILLGVFGPPLIYSKIDEKHSVKDLALIVHEKASPEDIVVSYGGYEHGLSFYSKRRVMVAGERSELEFGSKQGDQSAWFIERYRFNQIWDSNRHVFVLIKKQDMNKFEKSVKTPIKVLGEKGDRLLIANR
jgi:Aminoarabinose transferase C-terminal domain